MIATIDSASLAVIPLSVNRIQPVVLATLNGVTGFRHHHCAYTPAQHPNACCALAMGKFVRKSCVRQYHVYLCHGKMRTLVEVHSVCTQRANAMWLACAGKWFKNSKSSKYILHIPRGWAHTVRWVCRCHPMQCSCGPIPHDVATCFLPKINERVSWFNTENIKFY